MIDSGLRVANPGAVIGQCNDVKVRVEILAGTNEIADADTLSAPAPKICRRTPGKQAHSAPSPDGFGKA